MSEQSSQARIAKTAEAKYILAIDHGTSGCKTALAGLDGEILGFEFEATSIQLLPGSGAEQDPEDWWQALIKTCRRLVEKFIGREMQTLNIIGGGAQSDVWCQIFADVLDCRIKRVKDPLFANARGAAYIAAVALGYIKFSDIPELTEIEQVFSPEPENRKMYTELFEVFLQIHKYNKSIYHGLNRAK